MNKLLILLLTLIFSLTSYAHTKDVLIIDILEPTSQNANYALLASDGQVYELASHRMDLVELSYLALNSKLTAKIKLSEKADTEDLLALRNEVTGLKLISEKQKENVTFEDFHKNDEVSEDILMSSYITDIDSEDKLMGYFKSMRRKMRGGSECFNRAYVWAWEMSFNKINGQRVHMGKTWMFFTRKYIRTYEYKWWFHVAPYMTLNKELRVMDRSFTREPKLLKDWSDNFIYSKEECKVVKKYSDYREHQEERDCYIILSSVHYWQPRDIEKAETQNQAQTQWSDARLRGAYKNAVGIFAKPPERD